MLCPSRRFEMLQRRRRDAKLVGQRYSRLDTQQLQNGVVVNRMSDTKHDFSRHIGSDCFLASLAITDAIRHKALALQNALRQIAKLIHQCVGHETRIDNGIFQLRIAAPLIVVDFSGANSFDEAQEMIEYVPVMCSQRSGEDSSEWLCIYFIAQAIEEEKALFENISYGTGQRRRRHVQSLLPITGTCARCKNRAIALVTNTVMARKNRRPLSPCTSMPRTVK